ncbi:ATP:cob(I)alamin adenosyltransferase [Salibacterium qingdaonense]|uniref:Corrinoid adenosyltransferase n=1 Tax=Salibacterium qingdaonense TaxID=266892 RepID=A0A1I4M6X5_9BACI|nr:ATP:cob(I)alamin adenosyltransferase [Salibacterium qingdaonense]
MYTRSGDQGKTRVIGGTRDKDDIRIEAYGTCDELNACTAKAAAVLDDDLFPDIGPELMQIQHELFDCGSDLSSIKEDTVWKIGRQSTTYLEQRIDIYTEEAPALQRFILPGGTAASAELHICRTVARRTERQITTLAKIENINKEVQRYINRLSDYFFAAARIVNYRLEIADVEYNRSAVVFREGHNKE